jgi:Holliday junction DNA helicase RuvA
VREKVNEAMLALVSLGYKQQEAQAAIDKVLKRSDSDLSLEEIIKQAFKEM